MKNFKIILEYDGTNYFGWQRQKDEKNFQTVQGEVEKVLQKIFCKKVSVTASGRTDAGVHAQGQVASFKVDTKIPAKNILRAFNTYLPEDVSVTKIEEAPLSFNARFSAKKKWYRYVILNPAHARMGRVNEKQPSVFNRFYSFYYPYKLNLALMKKASRLIEGKHDFSTIVLRRSYIKTREIKELKIIKNKNFIYIDVVGDGFMYKMVRRIVNILIDVGRGKITLEDVKKLLSGKKIASEVQTAPAKGLALMKVYY